MASPEFLNAWPSTRRHSQGFILLTVLVFLLLASLLSLGDLRAVVTQQRMVTLQLGAVNEFAYTESALNVLESFAVEELASITSDRPYKGGDDSSNSNACAAITTSDPLACTLAACSSVDQSTMDAILNRVGGNTSANCSFCPRPTPGCKSRLDEPTSGSPWATLPIIFKYMDNTGAVVNANYLGMFSTYMEYLGKAPCDYAVDNANVTLLGTYGSGLCPQNPSTVGSTPRCYASVPATYTCKVMRVTVSNQPATPLSPSVTLQSTVIWLNGSAKRISFRQVLP